MKYLTIYLLYLTKGWQLEDLYWRVESLLHKSLDLWKGINPVNRYLVWWSLADKFPRQIRDCEILAKIVSHAIILKADDFKYKNLPGTEKMCDHCNEFEIEHARHLILRCSHFERDRDAMFNEIHQIEDGSGIIFFGNNVDMLYTILGRPNDQLTDEQMEKIRLIILKYVATIYRINVKLKSGVG